MTLDNDERYFLEITAELLTDHKAQVVGSTIAKWWLVLSAIQYAWRDKNLSAPLRQAYREIGDKLAHLILGDHPDAHRIIEAGWNPELDQPASSSDQRNEALEYLRTLYPRGHSEITGE